MKKKCMVANSVLPAVFLACCVFLTIGCAAGISKTGAMISADGKGDNTTAIQASLPDVIYNSGAGAFFVFWQSMGGPTKENCINCMIVSANGKFSGKPRSLSQGSALRMLPKAAGNPFTGETMITFIMQTPGRTDMDVYAMIIDAKGAIVVAPFPVCTNPANELHPNIAFNAVLHEYFITYNDSRSGKGNGNIFGIILDERGNIRKPEFVINNSPGNQINPVVCHNPKDNAYLVNWEDFRNEKNFLKDPGNIMGALLDKDGTVLVNDIAMCVDTDGADEGDQRFNGIAYNPDKNEFLASWTDTRPSLKNIGIAGRIITAKGALGSDILTLVDDKGAQMLSNVMYVPEKKKYFIVYEHDANDLDVLYFMDKKAKLDIYVRWLSDTGVPDGEAIAVVVKDGNQRFTRAAYNNTEGNICIVWQEDFPVKKAPSAGHMISPGGNIYGALYGE